MSVHDLHSKPFDEGTENKLEIYRGYLREWLPVFMQQGPAIKKIQIFDLFAGPGTDKEGKAGSPVIALEEIHLALDKCRELRTTPPGVELFLNEYEPEKEEQLEDCVGSHKFFKDAQVHFLHGDFQDVFRVLYPQMKQSGVANLLFLDQNGVKQVTKDIFLQIKDLVRTDYLFYISSSTINRFKDSPAIINPLPLTADDLDRMNGTNVHQIVKDAYQRLAPRNYLVPFSFKKKANIYGLIFGTANSLGADKFLRICWRLDAVRGEANYEMEGISANCPSLFKDWDKPTKLKAFECDLANMILSRKIETNWQIYDFALRRGFLPHHSQAALTAMIKNGKIPRQRLSVSSESMKKAAVKIKLI